jgi:CrcB protein
MGPSLIPDTSRAALRRREAGELALVAAGAIPGALLRWRLQNTLIANLIGCLLIGMIVSRPGNRPRQMLLGGIGFCGSLTTFSTWILELARALPKGPQAVLAVLLPALGGGLLAFLAGESLGRRLGNGGLRR